MMHHNTKLVVKGSVIQKILSGQTFIYILTDIDIFVSQKSLLAELKLK